ncbi:MAG TPA: hypothetical protein VIH42_10620 [Thermoguttaceae bacterium]
MRALFVLTPPEAKRLIGRAVADMEEVKKAKENDNILIGHGSTNVYVVEEILGKESASELFNRNNYLSGAILRGTLCSILGKDKPPLLLLRRGNIASPANTMSEILHDFGRGSVFIKGANAIDAEGNAAVFMANPEGGTIGWAIGTILARGIRLIVPVGLEKLVPSVRKAVTMCGQRTLDYCQGLKVGMLPLSGATVITEIQALKILAGVESFHVASGGSSGSEGAVTLVAEGESQGIEKAIEIVESIKGEPPLTTRKGICETCPQSATPQPLGQWLDGSFKWCLHQNKTEEEIPLYLRNR